MKNSKDYSPKIQKLFRSIKRNYPKVEPVVFEDPIEAIVYASLAQYLDKKNAHKALKEIKKHFINYNELRVSKTEEIIEVCNQDKQQAKQAALLMTKVLREIFIKNNCLDLNHLKKLGKRQAKEALQEIEGITPFVVDYCLLTAFDSHTIPLTQKMIDYLKNNDLVYPDSTDNDIKGFLIRQNSASQGYEFYSLLRLEIESSPQQKPEKIKTAKAKTAKKKNKETSTKKKTVKKKKQLRKKRPKKNLN